MKPGKPSPSERSREQARAKGRESRASGNEPRPVVLDFIQSRIEAFDHARGGGVIVKKDPRGYTLLRREDSAPIARLRPKGDGDRFEILYWSIMSDRWKPVGSPGISMVLALPDALEFIANDPLECFWG